MRWTEIKNNSVRINKKPASFVHTEEAGEQIQELENPQIDAQNKRIERLNTQKKAAQIKKKQLKLRDDQAALAKLRQKK